MVNLPLESESTLVASLASREYITPVNKRGHGVESSEWSSDLPAYMSLQNVNIVFGVCFLIPIKKERSYCPLEMTLLINSKLLEVSLYPSSIRMG